MGSVTDVAICWRTYVLVLAATYTDRCRTMLG